MKLLDLLYKLCESEVVLDGMIRQDAECSFNLRQVESFAEIGVHIKTMLSSGSKRPQGNGSAKFLFEKLEELRIDIRRMPNVVVSKVVDSYVVERQKQDVREFKKHLLRNDSISNFSGDPDDLGRGIPNNASGGRLDNFLFFLHLLEHCTKLGR